MALEAYPGIPWLYEGLSTLEHQRGRTDGWRGLDAISQSEPYLHGYWMGRRERDFFENFEVWS